MSEWYYSMDGVQQGPATEAELRAKLADGSLDAERALVWKSGMGDWLPAAQVAELSTTSAPGRDPYAVPTSGFGPQVILAEAMALDEIPPGSEPFDTMACIKRGFDLTFRNLGMVLPTFLVWLALYFVVSFVISLGEGALRFALMGSDAFGSAVGTGVVVLSVVGFLLNQLVSTYLSLGAMRFMLNVVSGREANVGQIFGESRLLMRGFLASLLFTVMIGIVIAIVMGPAFFLANSQDTWVPMAVGLVIAVVLMALLATRYGLFMFAIVDRECGVIESFQYSLKITSNNRLNLVGLYVLSFLVVILGMIALCVGFLFAFPIVMLAATVAYRWMQYGHRAAMDHPGTQIPMLTKLPMRG